MNHPRLWSRLPRLLRVLASGGAATAVDTVVLIVLCGLAGVPAGAAAVAGCLAGGGVNFTIKRRWIFAAAGHRWPAQLLRYGVVVVGGGAVVSGAAVAGLVASGLPVLAAKAITVGLVLVTWTYPLSARLIFAPVAPPPRAARRAPPRTLALAVVLAGAALGASCLPELDEHGDAATSNASLQGPGSGATSPGPAPTASPTPTASPSPAPTASPTPSPSPTPTATPIVDAGVPDAGCVAQPEPACPPSPPGAEPRDPGIASGAECRGACGPDCPATCRALPAESVCLEWQTADCRWHAKVCTYPMIECGSHDGCRTHDACYDACATAFWPAACRRACDLACVNDHGADDCNSWRQGQGPYDSWLAFADVPSSYTYDSTCY